MQFPIQLNSFGDTRKELCETEISEDTSWIAKQNERASKAESVAEKKRKKLETKLEQKREQEETKMLKHRLRKKVEMEEHDKELNEQRKMAKKSQTKDKEKVAKKILSSRRPSVALSARMKFASPSSTPRLLTKRELRRKKMNTTLESSKEKTESLELEEKPRKGSRVVKSSEDNLRKSISIATMKEQDKVRVSSKAKNVGRFKSFWMRAKRKRPTWPVECPQVMLIMAEFPSKQLRFDSVTWKNSKIFKLDIS